MTRQRQLKALIRSRMDRTGETYMVARRHVLNARTDSEYELRGGLNPEVASLANAFANRGITDPATGEPISEALVLGWAAAWAPATSSGSSATTRVVLAGP